MTPPTALPNRTILLTGGTSLTSIAITKLLLRKTACNILLTSRRGPLALTQSLLDELCFSVSDESDSNGSIESLKLRIKQRVRCITFDWFSPSTYSSAFSLVSTGTSSHSDYTASGPGLGIHAIYLVPLGSGAVCDRMNHFVQYAAARGVKRFVLLSLQFCLKNDSALGKVYRHLDDLANEGNLEYAILYPPRFYQSIIRNSSHNKSTGEKRGSVDVSDLAEVAAEILLKEEVVHPSAEYVVMGSELLAYPQVVSLLSGNLCRPIVFERRSASQVQLRLPSGQFKICNPVTGLRVLDNLDDDNVPWD